MRHGPQTEKDAVRQTARAGAACPHLQHAIDRRREIAPLVLDRRRTTQAGRRRAPGTNRTVKRSASASRVTKPLHVNFSLNIIAFSLRLPLFTHRFHQPHECTHHLVSHLIKQIIPVSTHDTPKMSNPPLGGRERASVAVACSCRVLVRRHPQPHPVICASCYDSVRAIRPRHSIEQPWRFPFGHGHGETQSFFILNSITPQSVPGFYLASTSARTAPTVVIGRLGPPLVMPCSTSFVPPFAVSFTRSNVPTVTFCFGLTMVIVSL